MRGMSGSLKGKVALVTGGGSGIGEACARLFAEDGASVAVMGRRPAPLQCVADQIGGLAVPGDASRAEDCDRAVQATTEAFGRLDVLVSCAGVEAEGSVTSMSLDVWRRTMDTNLEAMMQIARACIPAMLENGGGSIVNVSSLASSVAPGNMAAYITSKTAIPGLSRSMAVDYGPLGIRVNTLSPGWVWTPMSQEEMREYAKAKGITADEAVDYATRYLPLGRMAEPVEIARCARFLASDDASFVTGTVLVADGGSSAVDVGYIALL
jgi:meso-butanediol dehydrogenase / (S,S)-butanediol dehydrogenase / diacetyl reductase